MASTQKILTGRASTLLRIHFFFLSCLFLATFAQAELTLPALFGDHMVLQEGSPSVWGKAEPGKVITVSLAGRQALTTADPAGKWKAVFSSLRSGGPYEMILSGDGAVTLTDVLVGDVWLGSGQSNMEFCLKATDDAADQVPKADMPGMRLFTLAHHASGLPVEDVQGSWKVCTPDTAKEFSAVAYHFGRQIQQTLKKPIGLIVSCWGGTAAETWVPRDELDKVPAFAPILQAWDNDSQMAQVWGAGAPYSLRLSGLRLTPKAGKGQPLIIPLPGDAKAKANTWNCSVAPGSTGTFTAEGKGPEGGPAALLSGLMKGGCWITLTSALKPESPTVSLGDFDAVEFYAKGSGKYRMKLGQPSIADYDYYSTDVFSAPDTWTLMRYPLLSLKQGGWGETKPFTPDAVQNVNFTVEIPYWPDLAGVAYNGMIAPLTPFDIKGVLWYQGESNAGRASDYHLLLSTLIRSWRGAWGKDLPFLIVQLPNYMAVKPQPSESGWAELREAQYKILDVPGTAVVTTIDLGAADNIHPKKKTEVGRRLSLAALGMVYHQGKAASGPRVDSLDASSGAMRLKFKNAGGGLATADGGPVTGFALCDADGNWAWAQAKITGRNRLKVWNDAMKDPVEIRYAWADNPLCNLVNQEGLPAFPFRYRTVPEPPSDGKAYFENWKILDGSNAGTYADTKGSKILYAVEKGPAQGLRAIRLTYTLAGSGFCGLWHNAAYDLSKGAAILFQAKGTLPGQVQVALKDKWNVQYVAMGTVQKDWTQVRVPLSAFVKDPYYTPDGAQPGHPMDLSRVQGINFGPQAPGEGDLWVGPLSLEESPIGPASR